MKGREPAMTWVGPEAVAGRFYPADAHVLESTVRAHLDRAQVSPDPRVRAVIVPHAGYACSGTVAAHCFRSLMGVGDAETTVYLMGPAHWLPVHGAGLSSACGFSSPLGPVPIATDPVARLIGTGEPYHIADAAHEVEHALAVQLPFLQLALGRFRIVPMLLDGESRPEQIADGLAAQVGDGSSLIVVSSDLSHGYAYEQANTLDRAFLAAVTEGDVMAAAQGVACGLQAILCLMHVAHHMSWTPRLLDYRNSGDTCGSKSSVVGYGAVAYGE